LAKCAESTAREYFPASLERVAERANHCGDRAAYWRRSVNRTVMRCFSVFIMLYQNHPRLKFPRCGPCSEFSAWRHRRIL
jgi:hypothetical protein